MAYKQPASDTWHYEYLPYRQSETPAFSTEIEIPNYRIFPSNQPEHYIAETNEHLPGDLQERHALLIAAAPNLYEALEYFFNIMHDYPSSRQKGYVKFAIDQARAALAKADGRAGI